MILEIKTDEQKIYSCNDINDNILVLVDKKSLNKALELINKSKSDLERFIGKMYDPR